MSDSQGTTTHPLDALEPLKGGTPEINQAIKRILKLESERLYQLQPHLNDDVLRIIKEEVK